MAIDATNALTTLNEMKTFLHVDNSDDDATINNLIDAVSQFFNTYCGRKILARALTEYYDGNGKPWMYVRNPPITTVTTLHVDSERAYGADKLIDSGDYALYQELGKITLDNDIFPAAPQSIKIVYNGGWTAANVPKDLLNACKEMINFLYSRSTDGNRIGIESISREGVTTNYVNDMPETVKMVLDKYRIDPYG